MARKAMTPEEKAAWAEKMKQARAKGKAEKEEKEQNFTALPETEKVSPQTKKQEEQRPKTETEREVDELKALVSRLQQQLAENKPQVVQVMADVEKVVMRFQAEVADDNVAVFGANAMYGQVTGKSGTVIVPKSEWSRFYTESVRGMINRRWLIVLSGLSDDERKAYNCVYREGEILDEKAFMNLLDMGRELLAVFPALCQDHKEMMCCRIRDAWAAGDSRVNDRDLIVALNELSKEGTETLPANDLKRKGLLWPVIEAMNEKDAETR